MLDLHLAPHIAALTNMIRSRALVLYFQPFASIRLERMSQAFGWSVDELEQQVVSLIQSGEIKARVDRQNKVRKPPPRLLGMHPLCRLTTNPGRFSRRRRRTSARRSSLGLSRTGRACRPRTGSCCCACGCEFILFCLSCPLALAVLVLTGLVTGNKRTSS